MSVIPGILAYPWAKKKYKNSIDQGSFILAAVLSNLLTLGGLAVFILYGEVGYAYTQLVVLFGNIVLFMVCFPLAQYFYQSGQIGYAIVFRLPKFFLIVINYLSLGWA